MVREARLGNLRAFLHVQRVALDLGNHPNLGVLGEMPLASSGWGRSVLLGPLQCPGQHHREDL